MLYDQLRTQGYFRFYSYKWRVLNAKKTDEVLAPEQYVVCVEYYDCQWVAMKSARETLSW